jgi:hypothetical protein
MSTCGLFDVACKLNAFFAPIIYWTKIGFVVVCVLAVVLGLIWVQRKFGWWGLLAVASAGASVLIFTEGVKFGQRHSNAIAVPPTKPKNKRKPASIDPKGDDVLKHIFNGDKF